MISLSLEKGKIYQREELINRGFTQSKLNSPSYIVFKKLDRFYLFKETSDHKLLLDYVGY